MLRCPFAHPTIVYRTKFLKSLNTKKLYPELPLEDYNLWMKLLFAEKANTHTNTPLVLLLHRKHSSNSSKMSQIENEISLKLEFYQKLLNTELSPDILKEFILATNKKVDNSVIAKFKNRPALIKLLDKIKDYFKCKIERD